MFGWMRKLLKVCLHRAGEPTLLRPYSAPEPRLPNKPYPKNAHGDFYVEEGVCVTCRAPEEEAPDLMTHDMDDSWGHCYFRKQPETAGEIDQAVSACNASCTESLRYRGDDPEILKRLPKNLCDIHLKDFKD